MGGWKTVIPMSGFGATEDFACLMSRVQASGGLASYLQVGTDRAAGHHSDRFDFDETCLGRALELLARLAVRMAGGGQEDTETETESDMEFLDEVVRRKGIHVQLWLEGEDGEGFGRGRVELLQLVDELGSLSKAAKQSACPTAGVGQDKRRPNASRARRLSTLRGPSATVTR